LAAFAGPVISVSGMGRIGSREDPTA
jgi:hypothetical protein